MSDQLNQVLFSLRDEIVTGRLPPGTRLVEARVSERFGVSRTPVRPALRLLEAEGLLEPAGARGYRVKNVDEGRIRTAILARGLLEGFAAREVALKGLDPRSLESLNSCLEEGDRILMSGEMPEANVIEYNTMNRIFHNTIIDACDSSLISSLIMQCSNVPFAGINHFFYDQEKPKNKFRRYQISHAQHHVIVAAILQRDTGRAEAAMREHANNSLNYVRHHRLDEPLPPQIAIVPQSTEDQ
jgi:GntR family transcriptional regulator of vanillate catabolism